MTETDIEDERELDTTVATQVQQPVRTTIRTSFQAAVALAVMAPLVYEAATNSSPEQATGYAAIGLAVAAGVTRVMALPQVEDFLVRFVPVLATKPKYKPKHSL